MPSYSEMIAKAEQMEAEGATYSNNRKYAELKEAIDAHPLDGLVETLKKEIIGLDRQLDNLGPLSLTDEEKQAFLDKAIESIAPYYDKKTAEVEQRLEEGEFQTAYETLDMIRDVEREVGDLLSEYDLSQAETEEDFANKLGALTAQTDDAVETKQRYWRQKVETEKRNQIKRGIFSSGIGKKERERLTGEKEFETGNILERSEEQQAQLETGKRFNLDNIRLAREAAQQRRIDLIGTPDERAQEQQDSLSTLGYESIGQLPSDAEWNYRSDNTGYTPLYDRSKLTDLEEQRRTATLSRAGEYEEGELGRRDYEYEQSRKQILAERAKKAKSLNSYGIRY